MKQTTAWIMLGAFLLLGLGPLTAATAQTSDLQKIQVIGSLPALRFGEAAWGDYDGDGDFDLFLTGAGQRFGRGVLVSQLYINNGDTLVELGSGDAPLVRISRYFDALNPTAPAIENVWQSDVAWADYDRDGDLDVLASGINTAGASTLRIYENVGGTDRLASGFTLPGVRNGDLDWGDYDNDGDLDFVVCGIGQDDRPVSVIYQNDVATGGGFVRRDVGLTAVGFCSTEWGDYDNDGDLDLLMTGIAAPDAFATRLYRNDGDGSFSVFPADLKSLLYASVAWGDYDADGDLDILISGARLTPFIMEGEIKIYRNDSGSFTDVSDGLGGAFENDVTMGRYQGAAAWGDFNNDGLLDFFVTGARAPQSSDRGQIYRTNPNDQFTKMPSENFDGGFFGSAFGGDHDNDGDLDLFFMGEKAGGGLSVEVLRNGLLIRNTPPSAPDGLQATPEGNAVTLTWNPASDSQTPTHGLTYNLRVGTTPDGLDVVSPMSVPATGHRLVPRRGNAEHNTSWTLKNLPPGTYYWSVQALDNSFKGSPFAQEGTFIIGG